VTAAFRDRSLPVTAAPPAPPIRVLVVDDHPVVRAGLCAMLAGASDLVVVGEAAPRPGAVAAADRLLPDVILMDLRLPELDGARATARILAAHPAIRVLVVTTYDTDRDILRAVEAGAAGYLLKDTPMAELADAVRRASRGETVLAPPAATALLTRVRDPGPAGLTGREIEVLTEVAHGLTNEEIGRRLFIGAATVKTHLLHVFAKLGVDDRTAAVTVAMAQGVLEAPAPG
jgi:DNA-binding NarL/FixJ family response regulator